MSTELLTSRVLFFGTTGESSRIALAGLLNAGVLICGVVIPAPSKQHPVVERLLPDQMRSPLPLAQPFVRHSIIELAWSQGIPVIATSTLNAPELHMQVAMLQPTIACVACFPRRIPTSLLGLLPQGFLNVHPSVLPAHRGPAPLFWTFHAGETTTGVTIHCMDESFDSGPIALQETLELAEGVSYEAADQQLWERGTSLLLKAIGMLEQGSLVRRAQPAGASYEPWPTQEHFTLDTQWSARRAFVFMRGTASWGRPFLLPLAPHTLELSEALSYQPQAVLGHPFAVRTNDILVQFAPGVVHARGQVR